MTRFFLWLGEEKWLQFKSAVWENNLVVLQKGKHRICPNTLFFCCLVMSRRRQWRLTPVLLPGKSHGRRSLEGCSPCGRWGSDTTERLHFHFSLSRVGEGNGNPLQCSCLENPRGGGAWWAAVYGVTQSRTRLKWLSSSMPPFGLPWWLSSRLQSMGFSRQGYWLLLLLLSRFSRVRLCVTP